MKQFLMITGFLLVITLPFIGLGIGIINKVDDAYNRGYQACIDSMNIDKQCAAWLFESNIKEVKQRMCK